MPPKNNKRNYKRKGKRNPYRNGKARPMKALKSTYKAVNVYRFFRETLPETISPTVIPKAATEPSIGYLDFSNLKIEQLVNWDTDFVGVYANYTIDKIVTECIPMYQMVTVDSSVSFPTAVDISRNLQITTVSTSLLNKPFVISATSSAQRQELAQLQAKKKSLYANIKPLYITTHNPKFYTTVLEDPASSTTSTILSSKKKWLSVNDNKDAQFAHNSLLFMDRIDGNDMSPDYKYRVTHRVYFRCSQVG